MKPDLIEHLAECHPSLSRGQVWCVACGYTRKVNTAGALSNGWPKCCGATMTIDSPDERKTLEAALQPILPSGGDAHDSRA